jgi:hypothetical protein
VLCVAVDAWRFTALIEANEGAGVEEMLLAAEAERDRLTVAVAEFEKEAAVLQLLSETLDAAEGEAKTRYLTPVISRVEPYLKMLLPGANIVLDEDLRIAARGWRLPSCYLGRAGRPRSSSTTRLRSQTTTALKACLMS